MGKQILNNYKIHINGFRLLNVEPEKRLETIMHHYQVFNKTLNELPFDKLAKLSYGKQKEVPYEIHTEASPYNVMVTFNIVYCHY